MGEFSFDNLTAEVAELPKRAGGKPKKTENNPFLAMVGDSYTTNTGRSVTVPNAKVKDAVYLIRHAANELGLGVRVVVSLTKEQRENAPKNKNVKILFQGQPKRKYSPRKSKAPAEGAPATADLAVTSDAEPTPTE
jgi:hypothetical protein